VVVRVEPLGHLEGGVLTGAAGGGEGGAEAHGAVGVAEAGDALGQRAHGRDGVEHLVVVRERLGDRRVVAPEAQFGEALAGGAAQLGSGALELLLVDLAAPVRLDGALELTAAADPRVAEDRAAGEGGSGVGHRAASFSRGWVRMPASRSTASTVSWLLKA
jgi:hypothetical protein